MDQIVKNIEGTEVRFYQAAGRWVFSGSRAAGGYATADDAEVEARLQITNRYRGGLNTDRVPFRSHREGVSILEPLWSRF